MNPNHTICWPSSKPDFSIRHLRGTSTNRGYHETWYEVLSLRELDADAFQHLDDAYLLGSGQTYRVVKSEVVKEEVQPAVVDRRTGLKVECNCQRNNLRLDADGRPEHHETCASIPWAYNGQRYTKTNVIEHFRYEVLRICDSGD